jgi:hypothetical protein
LQLYEEGGVHCLPVDAATIIYQLFQTCLPVKLHPDAYQTLIYAAGDSGSPTRGVLSVKG